MEGWHIANQFVLYVCAALSPYPYSILSLQAAMVQEAAAVLCTSARHFSSSESVAGEKPKVLVLAGPTAVGKSATAMYASPRFQELATATATTTAPLRGWEQRCSACFFANALAY